MKKLVRFVIGLLIIAGALAFFKPTESDFEKWINSSSSKKRGNAKGDNAVEKLVDKGLTTATQVQVLSTYNYSNHHVLAAVKANANGEKLTYVGIAGFWVKLP
ncbi:MAG: hypothetical protein PF436_08465 [Prolixibacteraceae bacterium]|jgi:hypothetical protein|nr:hypothetical protein [Prolixibacteraceae bacterium]